MKKYYFKFLFDKTLSVYLQSVILKFINRGPSIPDDLRKRKILFIHIPKTGGSSVYLWLTGKKDQKGHFRAAIYQYCYPELFNDSFKFCVVRNPYHRLVSTYFFLKKGGINGYDLWFRDNYLTGIKSFEDFVCTLAEKKILMKWLHLIPQIEFCRGPKGEMLMDHIVHNEFLNDELIALADKLGMSTLIPHTNAGDYKTEDYDEFYSPKIKEMVHELYKDDFESFGYTK